MPHNTLKSSCRRQQARLTRHRMNGGGNVHKPQQKRYIVSQKKKRGRNTRRSKRLTGRKRGCTTRRNKRLRKTMMTTQLRCTDKHRSGGGCFRFRVRLRNNTPLSIL